MIHGIYLLHLYLADIKKAREWLQNEGLSASFQEIKEKWILTHETRKSELANSNARNLSDIFKSWVILRSPQGHELVSFVQFYFYFQYSYNSSLYYFYLFM